MTQNEKVLHHLRVNGGITSMEAFHKYGITRLAARISDLRCQGIKIANERRKAKNRDGKTVYFDRYVLKEDEK